MSTELTDRKKDEPRDSAPADPAHSAIQSSTDPVGAAVERFLKIRRATEAWTERLEPGDFVMQSMFDASPIGWQMAHTTWFFEEFVLGKYAPERERFHPGFQHLFNSYYDNIGERIPREHRGLLSRPGVDVIRRYRSTTTEAVVELLPRIPKDKIERALEILEIGMQHEMQHQELMVTDLKHAFSLNPLRPAMVERGGKNAGADPGQAAIPRPIQFVPFEGGLFRVGADPSHDFTFDIEGPAHRVHLEPFELADRAVTAGEWIEFIEAGGYEDPRHWLSGGWARATSVEDRWTAPLYWEKRDGEWWRFTVSGDERVDPDETLAHVSYYEADAYARWRGCRLPTEFEWEVAALQTGERPELEGRFRESLDFEPGRAPAASGGSPKLRQLFGDVWEWTSSAYAAYPGYVPGDGALGEYNGKFMSGQYILRGGSCATPRWTVRPSYRNFFAADARWQYSGLRLARDSKS